MIPGAIKRDGPSGLAASTGHERQVPEMGKAGVPGIFPGVEAFICEPFRAVGFDAAVGAGARGLQSLQESPIPHHHLIAWMCR